MNLWQRICGRGCAHRFSWPRIDGSGCHYQICLLCGTVYEYDWTMMRRTGRLMVTSSLVNPIAISANRLQSPTPPPNA